MIRDRILERRKALGLTQEELAKKLGYKDRSSINKIELGVHDVPQSKIRAFAEALETTPAYLLEINEKEPAEDLSGPEMELIKLFRLIPKDSQPLVLSMIKAAIKNL